MAMRYLLFILLTFGIVSATSIVAQLPSVVFENADQTAAKSQSTAKKVQKPRVPRRIKRRQPEIISEPLNVSTLTLGKSEITVSCTAKDVNCSQAIDVATVAPAGDWKYIYTVTAGKILGSGPNVVWDLTGTRPGVYTITGAVDDGRGILGMTKTKEVRVVE